MKWVPLRPQPVMRIIVLILMLVDSVRRFSAGVGSLFSNGFIRIRLPRKAVFYYNEMGENPLKDVFGLNSLKLEFQQQRFGTPIRLKIDSAILSISVYSD